jgi:glycosyltransferase involved in cell wall biosynthesis
MNNPLVSIIIPTYNRAHLIGETLDSILAQTYTNWECIVVDDGSTDETDKLLATYCEKDTRFQYLHRPNNRPKGANACRNYGFEVSIGEYVNWFDDDDVMLAEKLETQIFALHNSKYDYTICQTMMIDATNKKEIGLRVPNLISENIFEDYILAKIFWLTGAPLWKKQFLKETKLIFDEELHQAQDYDFHMRILYISENYLPIDKPMVLFKQHEENMSNSMIDTTEKILSNAKVNNNILRKYKYKLGIQILNYKYRGLLYFFIISARNKEIMSLKIIIKYLIFNLKTINISNFNKLKLLIKLMISYFSFLLFLKGERFLKFDVYFKLLNLKVIND